MKCWIYEFHIFELRNKRNNITSKYATCAVAKRKLQACRNLNLDLYHSGAGV